MLGVAFIVPDDAPRPVLRLVVVVVVVVAVVVAAAVKLATVGSGEAERDMGLGLLSGTKSPSDDWLSSSECCPPNTK